MQRVLVVGLLLWPLASCGYLTQDDYGCAGMPQGVQCMSARQVYDQTHSRDALGPEVGGKGGETSTATASVATTRAELAPAPDTSDGRVPLRTPARVLRIYVGSYEDDKGSLHLPGAVFTEIEPRRWQVGLQQEADAFLIQPLRTGSVLGQDNQVVEPAKKPDDKIQEDKKPADKPRDQRKSTTSRR